MKVRILRKLLDTKRYIADYGSYVGIGSAYVHDLISIDKKTLEIKYALDTFKEGRKSLGNEELIIIWDKLHELASSGQLREIIDGNDECESPVKVFTVKDGNLVEQFTDKYEFPNTTLDGKQIFTNTHFLTKEPAIEYGIKESEQDIKMYVEQREEYQDKISKLDEKINRKNSYIKNLKSLM